MLSAGFSAVQASARYAGLRPLRKFALVSFDWRADASTGRWLSRFCSVGVLFRFALIEGRCRGDRWFDLVSQIPLNLY